MANAGGITDKMEIPNLLTEAWSARREKDYGEAQSLLGKAQNLVKADDYINLGRIFHIYMQIEYDHGNLSEALDYGEPIAGISSKDQ